MASRHNLLDGGEKLGVWAATWPSWSILLRCGLETKTKHRSILHSAGGGARCDAGEVALAALSTRLGIGENDPGYEGSYLARKEGWLPWRFGLSAVTLSLSLRQGWLSDRLASEDKW
jgi:hypothetical protein